MTSPHPRLVLQVFERLCGNKQFWEKLQPPGTVFCRHRIYTLAVVVRLMLVQRLLEGGSLSQAVQRFVQGPGWSWSRPRRHLIAYGGLWPGSAKTAHTSSYPGVRCHRRTLAGMVAQQSYPG